MIKYSFPEFEKKLQGHHGDTALYQEVWGRGENLPEGVKSFTDLVRITIKPGGTNRLHSHEDREQIYIILQGEGVMQVGEEKEEAKAGDAIFLPAQIPHGFFNTGKKTAVILLLAAHVDTVQ